MNIRTRLTLLFMAAVGLLMLLFSAAIYFQSEDYRREQFFARLDSRAVTTARLLVSVKEVDKKLLRIIDKNSIHALFDEKVLIFNQKNDLIYSSLDDLEAPHDLELLDKIRMEKKVQFANGNREGVGLFYEFEGNQFVVVSSAIDRYGRSKLENLKKTLTFWLVFGIGIVAVAGSIFAALVLKPLVELNREIGQITAGNLDRRIDEGDQRDEFAQLATNFNLMLRRLEASFESQQQFVSGASHELRTPLAAMVGQLQHVLDRDRSVEEYKNALASLHDDARTLTDLANRLLALIQSDLSAQRLHFRPVRADEALFLAQKELAKSNPGYRFSFDFEAISDDDSALTVMGEEGLLKIAFLNLMENACKFSDDRSVNVRLDATDGLSIFFFDKGVGIPPEDLERVFLPFFRSANGRQKAKGHGIGLALARRVARAHGGDLTVSSTVGAGSAFLFRLPRKH